MLTITQSKLKLWRKCRYAYSLRYIDKIVPRVPSAPAYFGTWFHKLLEAHYGSKSSRAIRRAIKKEYGNFNKEYNKLFKDEQEALGFDPSDVLLLYDGYKDFWKSDIIPLQNKETKEYSEHVLTIDLMKGIQLEGTLDLVAEENNFIYVFDNKTSKNEPPVEHLAFSDIQNLNYILLLDHYKDLFGIETVDGMIWNYVWTKPPSYPKLTQKGTISRDKSIVTWPALLEEFADEEGCDIDDETWARAEENYKRWFKRFKVTRRNILIKEFLSDAKATGKEIRDKAGIDKTRNLEYHCQWCDYKILCQTAIRGLDETQIKKTKYKSVK